ncbi:MAG: hypothetical protein ACYC99_01940 [Candidatus Geothermincolia bacterium]
MKVQRFCALSILPLLVLMALVISSEGKAMADTWSDTRPGAPAQQVNALVWTGSYLYEGTADGHVYKYEGGTVWTDTGNPSFSVECLLWTGTGLYAGCGDGRVYRYDGGTTWTDTGAGAGSTEALAWTGGSIYAGHAAGNVYRYDGGTTWTDTGSPGGASSVNAVSWSGSTLFAGCTNGHIYSYDGGTSWTDRVGLGSPITAFVWSQTRSVSGNLYVGCSNGQVYGYDGSVLNNIGSLGGSATALSFSGTKLYAGCSNGHVYRYNSGTSWTDIGTIDTQVNCLSYDGTYIYGGCSDGHIYKDQLVESVNASVSGGHGILFPPTQTVSRGGKVEINIAPDDGYHVATVSDNGVAKPATSVYVIENVVSNHSVVVTLEKDTSAFYFAEGTCRPNFEPYICIQNPGDAKASVTITYMLGDGTTKPQELEVGPHTRTTVTVKSILGEGDDAAHDFSARVECTNGQQIIAERPMYFNYKGVWTGGHDVVGFTPE